MSDPALAIIKYVFLALLYLFLARVIRAVWAELREPELAGAHVVAASAGPADRRRERRGAAELVVTAPEEMRGQTFGIGQELTVGRSPGCGVSLPADTFVSQVHARLFVRDGDVWVEDLGSTNGTLLNGRKVTAAQAMHRDDTLQIGRTVLQLSR